MDSSHSHYHISYHDIALLLKSAEQIPLDISYVLDGNFCPVCHDYSMFYPVQHPHIAGDRHITASGFFIVRQEVRDGNARLFLNVLFDNSKSCINHVNLILD